MRTVDNPVITLSGRACEWIEPPPSADLEVREERAQSLLTANDSPDIPFTWSVNPYRGCQHACAYCYARRTHEYLDLGAGTDFETRITVKINAPELLAAELARPGWKRASIAFSGVTDCYQPLESRYKLTRQCLEVCRDRANPVGIITKSPLILRDLDVLTALAERADVNVHLSIAFADDALARKIDAGAPLPSQRFETLRRLRAAGLDASVVISPIIPGLNDADIPSLLQRAAEVGVARAAFTPLRLPGSVADVFLGRLRRALPDRAGRVEARLRDLRGGKLNDSRYGYRMSASGAYWESITRLFETMATRLGLNGGQNWQKCGPAADTPRQLSLFPDTLRG